MTSNVEIFATISAGFEPATSYVWKGQVSISLSSFIFYVSIQLSWNWNATSSTHSQLLEIILLNTREKYTGLVNPRRRQSTHGDLLYVFAAPVMDTEGRYRSSIAYFILRRAGIRVQQWQWWRVRSREGVQEGWWWQYDGRSTWEGRMTKTTSRRESEHSA